ncbi:hypothetical protein V5R04_14965 [Jonesiaceae bacterium BS-20]|uniref:Yip1 domain-containing protein n=1 Tax=Jonesiaceae bacterium BS-20 TaxID=3120821 RepID=A0AAU7DVY6_9MICO
MTEQPDSPQPDSFGQPQQPGYQPQQGQPYQSQGQQPGGYQPQQGQPYQSQGQQPPVAGQPSQFQQPVAPQAGGYQPQGQPGQFQQPGAAQPGYQPQAGQFQQGGYQPQAQQGGYQQQGQPGQFQQAGYAQAPVAPSGDFSAAFSTWFKSFTQIYTGKTDQAIETIATDSKGNREHPFWIVAAIMSAGTFVLTMLLGALILNSRLSGFYELGEGVLRAILIPVVVVAALLSARAMIVKVVFGMGQQQIGFQESANIVAIGFVAFVPYALLQIVNSATTNDFTLFLNNIVLVFCALLAELLIFKALTARVSFSKPFLLPYVGMTAGLIAIVHLLVKLVAGGGFSLGLY